MPTLQSQRRPHSMLTAHIGRGVSLIEALVALGVMAFGILGVMSVQSSLRSNSDLARQRSQATRIAQERLEEQRRFSALATTPSGRRAYTEITSAVAPTAIDRDSSGTLYNTSYSVSQSVQDSAQGAHKEISVQVNWLDRNGQTQQVRLNSVVARQDPVFAASVVVKPNGSPTANPLGRQRSIPIAARDFGDGTSGFRPPQAPGGNVALLFDNFTGLVTTCITAVASNAQITSSADLTGCDNAPGAPRYKLLGGYVRYATSPEQPSLYNVLNAFGPLFPVTTVQLTQTTPVSRVGNCFSSLNLGGDYLTYYCLMQVLPTAYVRGPGQLVGPPGSWSGSIQFTAPALSSSLADNNASLFKVCRFQSNGEYTDQRSALVNENFVLIRSGDNTESFFCPFTPGQRDVWPHQPET